MPNLIKLSIGGIILHIRNENMGKALARDSRWQPFLYTGKKHPEIRLKIESTNKNLTLAKRKLIYRNKFIDICENGNKTVVKMFSKRHQVSLVISGHKIMNVVEYLKVKNGMNARVKKNIVWNPLTFALQFLINHYLISNKKGILMHASAIRDSRGGLVFMGKSGSGKTTILRFTNLISNKIKILNDERILIKKIDNKFKVYHNPWHGNRFQAPVNHTQGVDLKSLYLIRQSRKNKITRLRPAEAIEGIIKNTFISFNSQESRNFVISLSQELANSIPCYLLEFKQDHSFLKLLKIDKLIQYRITDKNNSKNICDEILTFKTKKIPTFNYRGGINFFNPHVHFYIFQRKTKLYILDKKNSKIFTFPSRLSVFNNPAARYAYNFAWGNNFLYLINSQDELIYKYSLSGVFLAKFGLRTKPLFKKRYMDISNNGDLYVTYPEKKMIVSYSEDGKIKKYITGERIVKILIDKPRDILYGITQTAIVGYDLKNNCKKLHAYLKGYFEFMPLSLLGIDNEGKLYFGYSNEGNIYSYSPIEKIVHLEICAKDLKKGADENWFPISCHFINNFAYVADGESGMIHIFRKTKV